MALLVKKIVEKKIVKSFPAILRQKKSFLSTKPRGMPIGLNTFFAASLIMLRICFRYIYGNYVMLRHKFHVKQVIWNALIWSAVLKKAWTKIRILIVGNTNSQTPPRLREAAKINIYIFLLYSPLRPFVGNALQAFQFFF